MSLVAPMSGRHPRALTFLANRARGSIVVGGASIIGLTSVASAQSPTEVSEDGHRVASPGLVGQGGIAGGALFPATADDTCELRRQIGGLQLADMDNDGDLDLVVACYKSNSFPPYEDWENFILFNEDGNLEDLPSWISSDEVSSGDVQVGDIDGNGWLDVFVANGASISADSVIYFNGPGGLSTTPGWFSNEPDGAWNNAALLVDIDADGDLDVVTANQGFGAGDSFRPMHLFRNHDGALETVPSWSSSESSIQGDVAARDLDGDGFPEIAVSKWVNWESGVYDNVGGTPALVPAWTTGNDEDERGVELEDFNGDGAIDFGLGHDPTQVWCGSAKDAFDFGTSACWNADDALFHGAQDVLATDIDDDGDVDWLETHFSNGVTRLYLNDGSGLGDAPAWSFDSPRVGTALAVGDIDGDGRTDLVVGVSGDPCISIFYSRLAPPNPADLNGDGVVDGADLSILLAAWGGGGDADLDGSGTVDGADLSILLAAWSG